MPTALFDELMTWAQGIITAAPPDQLPAGSSPRGYNTTLVSIGEGAALMAKRKGAATLNAIPITGAPGIIGGFQFKKLSGTKYDLLVSDTGRLDQLNVDGTTSAIGTTAFTSGVHYPSFAVANDICFIVNDANQKKFDGTNVQRIGIARPPVPTAVTATAGGGMTAGIWDVGITYYNSVNGNESSLSDLVPVTLSGGNLKLTVTWADPTSTDAQVTHVRVYMRSETIGATIYRVVAGATPAADVTTGGYAPATLSTVVDVNDALYSSFILVAPLTTENEPPPAGTKFPVFHQSRMFLADTGNLYYSNLKSNTAFPEAFNLLNVQPVNPGDGDVIMGLASFNQVLYIFKKFSVYQLVGTDPGSWTVSLVTNDAGCSSHRSIVAAGGFLYWWAGALGPVVYGGGTITPPVQIGKQLLAASIDDATLNHQGFASVIGAVDQANQTILWAVPEFGVTRNTRIVPFNYQLKRFAAELWNPFDTYSMWPVETASKLATLYMGGYAGQVFQWWNAGNDGVPASTTTHGKVGSSTNTTVTDLTAAFAATGGKLVERYVYIVSADRQHIQRRRITSNTATALTVSLAWDTNPNNSYTYVVGGIDFQIDTPWILAPTGLMKKRFEFLLIQATSADASVVLDIDLFVSMSIDTPKKTRMLALSSPGAVYDATTSLYDVSTYSGNAMTYGRLRCGTVGRSWRARIRNCQADQDVLLYKVAMQSQSMGFQH